MPEPKPSDAVVEQRHRKLRGQMIERMAEVQVFHRTTGDVLPDAVMKLADAALSVYLDAERDVLARSSGVTAYDIAELMHDKSPFYLNADRDWANYTYQDYERIAKILNERFAATPAEQQESRTRHISEMSAAALESGADREFVPTGQATEAKLREALDESQAELVDALQRWRDRPDSQETRDWQAYYQARLQGFSEARTKIMTALSATRPSGQGEREGEAK